MKRRYIAHIYESLPVEREINNLLTFATKQRKKRIFIKNLFLLGYRSELLEQQRGRNE